MRAALRHFANVLIVAGVLLMADAALTVIWQEPMSAYIAHRQQSTLSKKLVELDRASSSPLERRALSAIDNQSARVGFLARSLRRRVPDGGALGRIEIPRIGASYVFVDGTDTADLRKGPGLYEESSMPGVGGTSAIAGHRTTYGSPFRHIDELKAGDTIRLKLPYGVFTYSVERKLIVKPTALWVTHRVGHDRLVLSACHPLYSAAKRIVIFARLARTEARGAAAA
jgi:sortase A